MAHLLKTLFTYSLFIICSLSAHAQRTIDYWEQGYNYQNFLSAIYCDYFHNTSDRFNVFPVCFNQFTYTRNKKGRKKETVVCKTMSISKTDTPFRTKSYLDAINVFKQNDIDSQVVIGSFNKAGYLTQQKISIRLVDSRWYMCDVSYEYKDKYKTVLVTNILTDTTNIKKTIHVTYHFNSDNLTDEIKYNFDSTLITAPSAFTIKYSYDSIGQLKQIDEISHAKNRILHLLYTDDLYKRLRENPSQYTDYDTTEDDGFKLDVPKGWKIRKPEDAMYVKYYNMFYIPKKWMDFYIQNIDSNASQGIKKIYNFLNSKKYNAWNTWHPIAIYDSYSMGDIHSIRLSRTEASYKNSSHIVAFDNRGLNYYRSCTKTYYVGFNDKKADLYIRVNSNQSVGDYYYIHNEGNRCEVGNLYHRKWSHYSIVIGESNKFSVYDISNRALIK